MANCCVPMVQCTAVQSRSEMFHSDNLMAELQKPFRTNRLFNKDEKPSGYHLVSGPSESLSNNQAPIRPPRPPTHPTSVTHPRSARLTLSQWAGVQPRAEGSEGIRSRLMKLALPLPPKVPCVTRHLSSAISTDQEFHPVKKNDRRRE